MLVPARGRGFRAARSPRPAGRAVLAARRTPGAHGGTTPHHPAGMNASAVQRDEYRDAKISTLLDTVPDVIGTTSTAASELRWVGPDGTTHGSTAVLLVSNNPYRMGSSSDPEPARSSTTGCSASWPPENEATTAGPGSACGRHGSNHRSPSSPTNPYRSVSTARRWSWNPRSSSASGRAPCACGSLLSTPGRHHPPEPPPGHSTPGPASHGSRLGDRPTPDPRPCSPNPPPPRHPRRSACRYPITPGTRRSRLRCAGTVVAGGG